MKLNALKSLLALGAIVCVASACPKEQPKPPAVVDAGAKASAATTTNPNVDASGKPKRPPYPNMATAAWGQRVLEEKTNAVHPEGPAASQQAVLDALHDLSPGSEKRAQELAASWFKTATSDVDRGEAVALLAVSMVLDPTVDGYRDRLVDAAGLAQYAGQLERSSSLNQAARVVVWALAGEVDQAKRLLEVVETTPTVVPEARFFMALGQKLTGGKLEAALDDVDKALAVRPTSLRAKSLLAEIQLEVGLYPEAEKTATVDDKSATSVHPWLDAMKGRALVLDGKVDEGIKLLKACQDKLDEGRRGDALYWLGRSLTQKEGTDGEVDAIIASLSARPGYAKEAGVLEGLKLVKAGDYAKAREKADALVKGPMMLPVDVDAAWLLVDACAGAGDADCVARAGSRAVQADGDYARFNLARSALSLVGKAPNIDVDEALKEAHRASPFDPKLAAKVKEPVVEGGVAAANRVRAARKAVIHKSPRLVDIALAPLANNAACRVCRALRAMAAQGIDQANLAAKAVQGGGPPLCVADDVAVIHALGAAPTPDATKALATFADDKRDPIAKAYARAVADHKDPDARRRRDAGTNDHEHDRDGASPPQINVPTPPGAPAQESK